ncbi:MAG: Hsp20/alpha crystallin family protein [Rhizobiaceae bacterium]
MVEKTHTAGWLPNIYEPLRNLGNRMADWFAPPSEASALDDFYEISVELPGVKPDDVEVTLQNGSLTVHGEKHSEREEEGRSYFFSERTYGAFQRTFRLPSDADNDNIEADYRDGVLNLKVGKKSAVKKDRKKIEVKRKS